MKKFASVWVMILALPLFLILHIIAWLLFKDTALSTVAGVLLQTSLVFCALWIAYRVHRAASKLETSLARHSHQFSKSKTSITKLLDLNTREVRRSAQETTARSPHPREIRAIDDVEAIREEVEKLRSDISSLKTLNNELIRQIYNNRK